MTIRPYRDSDRTAVVAMLTHSDPWKRLGYSEADWKKLFDPMLQGREGYVIEADGSPAGPGCSASCSTKASPCHASMRF